MNEILEITLSVAVIGIYIAMPLMVIWGWVRWANHAHIRSLSSILSLIGFSLATASGILAVSSLIYAHTIGGFPFYDPLLLRIYRIGDLLSLTGILFSLSGAWRPSPLRWHAPICCTGTLLFWFASAMGE
jgi:hypothetical protein